MRITMSATNQWLPTPAPKIDMHYYPPDRITATTATAVTNRYVAAAAATTTNMFTPSCGQQNTSIYVGGTTSW